MQRKITYNSPVILTFAGISFVALILGSLPGSLATRTLFSIYRAPLNNLQAYMRFFLHVIGHADMGHYVSNMLLLLVIGPPVEERFGSKSLLLVILSTALISGIIQFVFFPRSALLGASGIVFMLIIMSTFLVYKKGTLPLTMLLVFVLYIGGEVVKGIAIVDNVSQLAHIIGGICGGFFGYILSQRRRS
ncbi:MAG: rhomboid family intramembrane serine protease [Oscillospiraceae bacterium]|nr:rhomboid family intramembrane serine protease [Oscillospiraceae bacterium]